MNESRIQLKRKYTENHPASFAGEWAPVRNKVIEAIADGKITIDEFDAITAEMSASAKKWMRNNSKYFKIEEDGVSLSKYGRKVLAQIKPINEMNFIHTSFDQFLNEAYESNETEVVFEAFKSSKLAALMDLKNMSTGVLKGLYGFTKVKLDQVTDDQLLEMTPEEAYKSKRPNALFFYIVDNEKQNPYADRDSFSSTKVIPGNTLIAVADGNNRFYGIEWSSKYSADRGMTLRANDGDDIGMNKKYKGFDASGLYNVKRIADVADRVLVFDYSILPSSAEERAARAAAKAGATAFMDDKKFKAENMKRYREILATRASKDDIDGMVEKAVEMVSKHIQDSLKNKTMGRWDQLIIGLDKRGREISMQDAGNVIKNILDDYNNYSSSKKEAERYDNGFAKGRVAEYAKSIKDRFRKIENKDYAW